MRTAKIYICEGCGAEYSSMKNCKQHEKLCVQCKNCDHAYFVYCTELNCELLNEGKRCRFKPETKD